VTIPETQYYVSVNMAAAIILNSIKKLYLQNGLSYEIKILYAN